MKIAIITQPLKHNYGGILQNYALQQTLIKMGHEVETLEFLPGINSFKGRVVAFLKRLFFVLVDDEGRFLHIWKGLSSEQRLSQNTRCFIRKHISLKQRLNIPGPYDYDAYVVGSDQVWRPMYSNLDVAFLKFTEGWKKVKRVAYAASFGSENWEYTEEETAVYKGLISLFDAVSVREKSGVTLCRRYFDVDAVHVLDPTMLLTMDDYLTKLNIQRESQAEGDLFYYYLDSSPEKNNLVQFLANENGWKPFSVNSNVENISAPIKERIQPPVEKWLRGFYDAKFIITDSFHGCVFSIIFNKPFAVVVNNKRGRARFDSLLNLFGQNYRILDDCSSLGFDSSIMNCPNVDIDGQRALSLSFLERALEQS